MPVGYYQNIAKIKNNSVVVYRKWIGDKTKKMKDVDLLKNFTGGSSVNTENCQEENQTRTPYCGQMTQGARKRMIEIIELFSASIKDRWIYNKYVGKRVKHRFSFITLTVPDQSRRLKGKEGYDKLLEPFLFWLVKTKNVNTYIWKAELQQPLDFNGKIKQCKGQLHYHLILPNFIDKNEIRTKWNYLLGINDLLAGHEKPASTTIEKPYKGKYVSDYIIKEIAKNCQSTKKQKEISKLIKEAAGEGCKALLAIELSYYNELSKVENESIEGKVWGCSNNLKPKTVIKEDANIEDLVSIERKISFLEKQIKQNDSNPDKLAYDKQILYGLKKQKLSFYHKQKNYYEVEFTPMLFKKLNICYDIYEERRDWKRQGNIYENDFVTIYKVPMDYKQMMLDTIYHKSDTQFPYYIDDYNQYICDRVGVIYNEKTSTKDIEKHNNELASLIIEQKERKNYLYKKLEEWKQETLF